MNKILCMFLMFMGLLAHLGASCHCSSSSSSSGLHPTECEPIESAYLIGFSQTVRVDHNVIFQKIQLIDPKFFFNAQNAPSSGELIINHTGKYDIEFFVFSGFFVELRVNNVVIASTEGFPEGATIDVNNLHLNAGDVITLTNANTLEIPVTGAGLKVTLIHKKKSEACDTIEFADVTAFRQFVLPNENVLFAKKNEHDPQHLFDLTKAKKKGKVIIRKQGRYDIDFFTLSGSTFQLEINGKVVKSTEGFPPEFIISLRDIILHKGDVVTLVSKSTVITSIAGASLTISLSKNLEPFGIAAAGLRLFQVSPVIEARLFLSTDIAIFSSCPPTPPVPPTNVLFDMSSISPSSFATYDNSIGPNGGFLTLTNGGNVVIMLNLSGDSNQDDGPPPLEIVAQTVSGPQIIPVPVSFDFSSGNYSFSGSFTINNVVPGGTIALALAGCFPSIVDMNAGSSMVVTPAP